ncbi:MAG: pyridoxamine 5'-phosphate oxidase [Alphaproteobacteria bacterium]|nr:pyridoxamine 5'-phosphate oxidase [Alphaproteobacteria bacterium]
MEIHLPENPFELFENWLQEAEKKEVNDPGAMALATSTSDGKPSVRMVLLKGIHNEGFKFHTNRESQKGQELEENAHAALCFHWKSLRKQVRVEGVIEIVSDKEADDYFADRPYARQIGAWASQQSRPLESREKLENKIKELEETYSEGNVPRPPYWIGYRLMPEKIEFWWDNPDRLHDRFIYKKSHHGMWTTQRLYP